MARMKKRYVTLNRFLTDVREVYPDVTWKLYQASQEVNDIYGEGFLLYGKKGIFEKEFFILFQDTRRMEWAAMIQATLNDEVTNATS